MKIIHSDWLDTKIIVFRDIEKYKKHIKKNNLQEFGFSDCTRAFFQSDTNEAGETFIFMCFLDESILLSSIVHECSHVADYIFNWRGIDACTETRAYFVAWLFDKAFDCLKS